MVNDKTNVSRVGTEYGDTAERVVSVTGPAKVKFVYKLINFSGAVIALSWFFEGWRKINEMPSLGHAAILVAGTLATLFFLGVHAYWVYFKEKAKGTLKKRVGLFEKIYLATLAKQKAKVIVTDKGES